MVFSITVRNDSNIPLVIQLGTIGVHRHSFLKPDEEVTWGIGPGLPFTGWTIWCHYATEDDTTWGDIIYGPAIAVGTVLAAAVSGGVAAYAAAGIGASAMIGTGAIIAEGSFVGAGVALSKEALTNLKNAISSLPISEQYFKLKSSGWSSTISQRCRITGGMKIETAFSKPNEDNEVEFVSATNIGTPLEATSY
mgnify:CR=1 FL=1|tara:strand:- start:1715 stop:2296 length:582 start_codon:yes stop_codon:yes gene_type:complete